MLTLKDLERITKLARASAAKAHKNIILPVHPDSYFGKQLYKTAKKES